MKLLLKNADTPGYSNRIDDYLGQGGYKGLKKALSMGPEAIQEAVSASELRGRGGAGFPAGRKWQLLDRKSGKPIYLICNADESEPGTFKDRQLIHKDPHQLLEGMLISAYAINARQAFIYIRGEMYAGARILETAIEEARQQGLLGDNICGSDYSCDFVVHRGAGSYICGEETGLIESLEGNRPYPRIKPPYFPAVLGLYHCPTIVNNVETLCHIKHVIDLGAEAFKAIGTPNNTGTRIWSVSGNIQKPGYHEYPCNAITLGELLYDVCGGPPPGRQFQAIIPGGSSSKVLRAGERFQGKLPNGKAFDWGFEDIPLDFDSFTACGTMSGSAAVIAIDDSQDIVEVLANINTFYAHESCGQCTPCREGSLWMQKITQRMVSGQGRPEDADLLYSISKNISGRTICAHGEACAWPTESFVDKFRDAFRASASGGKGRVP